MQGLRIQEALGSCTSASHKEDWDMAIASMDMGMGSLMLAAASPVPVDYGDVLSLPWALHLTEVILPGISLCVESNPPANLK